MSKSITQRFRRAESGSDGAAANQSAVAEAFRILQVSIGLSPSDRGRVILITSAVPDRGKSYVAAGLAISLARETPQVLLVDADQQTPSLHRVFGLEQGPGFAQLLLERTPPDVSSLIQKTDSGVDVILAGLAGPAAFSRGYPEGPTQAALAALRDASQGIIIIDSPPLLASAGAQILARCADAVVMTVRSGVSRPQDLRKAREVLQQAQARLAGAILIDHDEMPFAGSPAPSQDEHRPSTQHENGSGAASSLTRSAEDQLLASAPGGMGDRLTPQSGADSSDKARG